MSVEDIKKCLKLTCYYMANERLKSGFNPPTMWAGRAKISVYYDEENKGGIVDIASVENAHLVYSGGYLNPACPIVGRYKYIVTEGQVVDRREIAGVFNYIAGCVDKNNNPVKFPCGWEEHPEMQTRVKEAIYALIELTGT